MAVDVGYELESNYQQCLIFHSGMRSKSGSNLILGKGGTIFDSRHRNFYFNLRYINKNKRTEANE